MKATWTEISSQYIPEEHRESFLNVARRSVWYPINEPHPFTPAKAAEVVAADMVGLGLGVPTHIAYGETWRVREDDYLPVGPGDGYCTHTVDALIIGLRYRAGSLYIVDYAVKIMPAVLVSE